MKVHDLWTLIGLSGLNYLKKYIFKIDFTKRLFIIFVNLPHGKIDLRRADVDPALDVDS